MGSNPYDVATADLNADGKLDLVTANYSSSTVSVYTGNGDGTFSSRVDYSTGSNPTAVARTAPFCERPKRFVGS